MINAIVLLPREYANMIETCGARCGLLAIRSDHASAVHVVDGYRKGKNDGGRLKTSKWVKNHYLAGTEPELGALWFQADPELHRAGLLGAAKSYVISLEGFRRGVEGWIEPGHDGISLALTFAKSDTGISHWQAWALCPDEDWAAAVSLQIVDEDEPLLAPLAADPEVRDLCDSNVVVIGAGSIGSHATDALASYGVRRLTIVDPDRLLSHNFARHRASRRDLGRHKVTAERERLLARDPELSVVPLKLDVVFDADAMRPLFDTADIVLVTADGIDARRAANHIARRARTPAVFACVLENGAYGEIVRVGRASSGCLWCARRELLDSNGIAWEVGLDQGYGAPTRHRPMTAVPGDLGLVGQLAAKVTVATLLEVKGHPDQRLPGDQAVISLRPRPDRTVPFDATKAGVLTWRPLPPPHPDCPSCGT